MDGDSRKTAGIHTTRHQGNYHSECRRFSFKEVMKPIETHYKGYRFRSRLEARWGVFFDVLRIGWEYEREGFEFDNGVRYLPDFYLPDYRTWCEVKPTRLMASELKKCKLLALQKRTRVLMLVGVPDFVNYNGFEYDPWQDKDAIFQLDYTLIPTFETETIRYFPGGNYTGDLSYFIWPELYRLAVQAARSARFEFNDTFSTAGIHTVRV